MRHHQDLKSKKWYKNKEAASFGSSLFAGLTGPDIYIGTYQRAIITRLVCATPFAMTVQVYVPCSRAFTFT